MCGIIGYVGSRPCKSLLVYGLERLEYRGYDSAGLALLEDGRLEHVRAVGNLQFLKEAAAVMTRCPQALESVPVARRELTDAVLAEVTRVNAELGDEGRVLVRRSGTEPVVRVLAEARTEAEAKLVCGTIVALVARELG